MSGPQRDPIFDQLDRLAGLADGDPVGDRMPDIRRRVRVNRQRKVAGAAVAAAVLALGGIGILQNLPGKKASPPPTKPGPQVISISVEQRGSQLQISLSVSGEGTPYVDTTSGQPTDYVGPASIKIKVDGSRIPARYTDIGRGDLTCRPGPSQKYAHTFFADKPAPGYVATPGSHRIEVSAPYCLDGELVESTGSITVDVAQGESVFEETRADIDGDGTSDTVQILKPFFSVDDATQRLLVTWGSGGAASVDLPDTTERSLGLLRDFDGDGSLEIVTDGGGGDYTERRIFTVRDHELVELQARASDGSAVAINTGDLPERGFAIGPRGFVTYGLASSTQLPATVQMWEWTLEGTVLSEPAAATTGCLDVTDGEYVVTEGPCA